MSHNAVVGMASNGAEALQRVEELKQLNKLDDMIAGLTGPRTEVDDPDGLVRFTLSDDERLLSGLARNFGDVFVGAVMRRA